MAKERHEILTKLTTLLAKIIQKQKTPHKWKGIRKKCYAFLGNYFVHHFVKGTAKISIENVIDTYWKWMSPDWFG